MIALTDVRGSQDCARDKEVVDHLETAIDPGFMPARAVIKSGDEKRRIIFRSVPSGDPGTATLESWPNLHGESIYGSRRCDTRTGTEYCGQ